MISWIRHPEDDGEWVFARLVVNGRGTLGPSLRRSRSGSVVRKYNSLCHPTDFKPGRPPTALGGHANEEMRQLQYGARVRPQRRWVRVRRFPEVTAVGKYVRKVGLSYQYEFWVRPQR